MFFGKHIRFVASFIYFVFYVSHFYYCRDFMVEDKIYIALV